MGERTTGDLCKGIVREVVKIVKLAVRDLTVSLEGEGIK